MGGELIVTKDTRGENFVKIYDSNFKEGGFQKYTKEQIQFAYE